MKAMEEEIPSYHDRMFSIWNRSTNKPMSTQYWSALRHSSHC